MKNFTPSEEDRIKDLLAVIGQSNTTAKLASKMLYDIICGGPVAPAAASPIPLTLELFIKICFRLTNNPDIRGLNIKRIGMRIPRVVSKPEKKGITALDAERKYRSLSPDTIRALWWFAKNKKEGWFAVLGVERNVTGVPEHLAFYQNESGSMRELHWLPKNKEDYPGSFEFLSVAD